MSKLYAFTMPKWGIEMTEGVVSEWSVAEGDAFERGQLLALVETEKIVNEIEAEYDAVCLRRIAEEGDTLAVGELLAVFGEAGATDEAVDAFVAKFKPADIRLAGEDDDKPGADTGTAPGEAATDAAVSIPDGVRVSPAAARLGAARSVDLTTVTGCGRNGRIQLQDVEQALRPATFASRPAVANAVNLGGLDDVAATDVAKRVAAAAGLDLSGVKGSGKGGRIRVADLKLPAPASAPGATRIPFSTMRAQIARRLTASYRDIPHYYLQTVARVDALMAARRSYNDTSADKATLNDFLVRAVAKTLVEHPGINAHVGDGEVVSFAQANIAIAVAIEGGLITPVVTAADSKPFEQVCADSRELVHKARKGGLTMDDLSGGTFTISNLGMFGVTRFTALINPPQAAILAVGAIRREAVESPDGIEFVSMINLTLGADHRAVDGAMGGRFLADLKARLEDLRDLPG